jgi:phosphopantothenoylcysteine decarboxylase/phosphopantothenate--cysteine ligase
MLQLRTRFAKTVHVVLTQAALRFLPLRVVKYYGFTAWTDMFEPRGEVNVPHIHLASTASMVAVIPASAHTIHRLATGECSDLLSLIVAATKAPVVVAPAMNPAMLRCPAVDRNVTQLQEDGIYVVEPGFGWEVSEREINCKSVGGIGVKAHNVVPVLQSILLASKRLSESPTPVPIT